MSRRLLLPTALGLALLVAACSRPAPADDPIRSVKLVTVAGAGPLADSPYAADIRARVESRLGFRVGGKLVQRPVEVGQRVRAGQVLALLDPQDLGQAAQAADALALAARSQRDQAAQDLQRSEALLAQGFVSDAERDRRRTALQAADAAWAQAEAQARVQRNQVGYSRLLADHDGVVVAVEAEPGQVMAVGAPVLRLAHDGPRDAVFALPEDRVTGLQVGATVQVVPWSQPTLRWSGRVREVAASADPVTRTYQVRVALPAEAQAPLGATATVTWAPPRSSGAAAQLRLPSAALWQQGAGSAVWVFDPASSVVRARAVQVAGMDGNEVLVAAGLQPGEEVVAAGVHVLTEGQAVVRHTAPAAR
jgi:membrane fusion protein, multidrug efflux system